jgi:hypothetical protein
VWKAQEIVKNMTNTSEENELSKQVSESELHSGFGKVILSANMLLFMAVMQLLHQSPMQLKPK